MYNTYAMCMYIVHVQGNDPNSFKLLAIMYIYYLNGTDSFTAVGHHVQGNNLNSWHQLAMWIMQTA